jgi:hypothetical protein
MMKTQIGLGLLAIPTVFDTLGMIPGVVCLCLIAGLNSWSNYRVGAFKLLHPEVYDIDDVGQIIFGRIGREVLAVAFCLCRYTSPSAFWMTTDQRLPDEIFVSVSAILSTSIGLNAVSTYGICTAIFVAITALATFGLSSIRTLSKLSWLVWIGLSCILVSGQHGYTTKQSSTPLTYHQFSLSPSHPGSKTAAQQHRKSAPGRLTTSSSTRPRSHKQCQPSHPSSSPSPARLSSFPL